MLENIFSPFSDWGLLSSSRCMSPVRPQCGMAMYRIEITCFTDSYCSWCWASEPMLYRIRETYRHQVRVRYVMGGLVRDMADFYDSLEDIRTTAEVAPH